MKKIRLAQLPIASIRFDSPFQRPLNKAWIDAIDADFDEYGIGAVSVAQNADGSYSCLDGQHRIAVLRRRGIPRVLAVVYEGLEDWERARIFVRHNSSKRVRAYHLHRALLEARDPDAMGLEEVVTSVGTLRIADSPGQDAVRCMTTLRKLYRASNPPGQLLADALTAIYGAWGGLPDAYESAIVGGVGKFLAANPGVAPSTVSELLVDIGAPLGLLGRAKAISGGNRSMGTAEAVSEVLAMLLKRRKRPRAVSGATRA